MGIKSRLGLGFSVILVRIFASDPFLKRFCFFAVRFRFRGEEREVGKCFRERKRFAFSQAVRTVRFQRFFL
jgi:hypothetical protein